MAEKYKPVIFEDSQGNIISNDPIWRAQQTLKAAGVGVEESSSENSEEKLTEEQSRDYKELDQKALKELAAERNVDISGLTKVGEVRQALVDADAAAAAEAEVNAANA